MANLFKKLGDGLNDLLGVSSSAKGQFRNQMKLQKDAQEFSKWQMQNAHQTEVKDLQDAGLNPILSANAGASAGVTEGSASAGQASGDPFSILSTIVGMMNSTKQTDAEVTKAKAEANNLDADTKNKGQQYELQPQIVKSLTKLQDAETAKSYTEANKAFQEQMESQARTIGQEILNQASGMDLTKRKTFFDTEMEVAKQQLKAQLTTLGFEGSPIYQAVDRAFATVGKVLSGSVSYTYGNNTSHSTSSSSNNSNVNVKSNGSQLYKNAPIDPLRGMPAYW